MTSIRVGSSAWDGENLCDLTLFLIRLLNTTKSLNNIIYGIVIVGVPETPC